jgi:hypothetical protein
VLSFGNKKMNANNLRANITIKIMQAFERWKVEGGGWKDEGEGWRVKGASK